MNKPCLLGSFCTFRRAIRFCTTSVMVMGIVLGFGIQQASGAIITTSHPFRLQAVAEFPDSGRTEDSSLPLNQFDPTLGVLTGVTIEIDTWAFTLRSALLASVPSATSLTAVSDVEASVVAWLFDTNLRLPNGKLHDAALCSASSQFGPDLLRCVDEFSLQASPPPSISISTADPPTLALYVGNGTILVDYRLGLETASSARSDSLFPVDLEAVSLALWAGETRISYEYTPAVVPVPAAAWLLVSGLLSLIGLARRKRVLRP